MFLWSPGPPFLRNCHNVRRNRRMLLARNYPGNGAGTLSLTTRCVSRLVSLWSPPATQFRSQDAPKKLKISWYSPVPTSPPPSHPSEYQPERSGLPMLQPVARATTGQEAPTSTCPRRCWKKKVKHSQRRRGGSPTSTPGNEAVARVLVFQPQDKEAT